MKKCFLLYIFCSSQLFADLISPPNGSTISYIQVKFEWEAIDNSTKYEFELSSTNDFSSRLISREVADLQYFVKDYINWETTYYWRVKAVGGSWFGISSFNTGSTRSNVNVIMYDENQYADGNTIFGSADGSYSAIIDKEGTEIWNSGEDPIIYYNFLDDERFFGCRYDAALDYEYPGVKFSLTDGIVWQEPNEELVHHEFLELPWGDYMGIAHQYQNGPVPPDNPFYAYYVQFGCVPDGITNCWPWQGDRLVIWDKDTKEVVWSWSTFDYFNMSDVDINQWNQQPQFGGHFDWTHVNAFYFDDSDNSIYISTRNLSRITKLQYPSGEIIWNMGHEYPSGDVEFGHDLGFSYQHSISLTDENNILILDNGNYSEEYWGSDLPTSRALEISVSESQEVYSADIAWEYVLSNDLFSPTAGNVQKLDNGNYLITTMGNQGTSLEVSSIGDLIWEANYSSEAMWRASRISQCGNLGDMNEDGIYNILDVVAVVNCALLQNCDEMDNGCAGDLNEDGIYNILDVVAVVNCALYQNCG